jgi:hypothetical protein
LETVRVVPNRFSGIVYAESEIADDAPLISGVSENLSRESPMLCIRRMTSNVTKLLLIARRKAEEALLNVTGGSRRLPVSNLSNRPRPYHRAKSPA